MNPFSNKTCANCKIEITGRLDKKFCCDQCRATFNNRSRQSNEHLLMETNRQVRRNRKILRSLCPTGKATVRQEVAAEMGFEFGMFTSIFPSQGKVYYFSYEYGFMPIVDDQNVKKMVIVQQQDYMKDRFDPWKFIK
ncbi:MAG: hypothetical protein JXR03_01520 [Cyclobacteriaceae bacterium]